MHFRSRKLEFTQYGENTNEHCSMKVNSSLSSLILLLVMMVYILSENFRKLHTSVLENNCYVDHTASYSHINRIPILIH